MTKRSNIKAMLRLVGLVKPLLKFMILAVAMGLLGHIMASLITVFAGYALLNVYGQSFSLNYSTAFIFMGLFAILRGALRYLEQMSNHYIAFKLLALIRDKVFLVLRKLCPAKLEGKDKGNLITLISSDIELLEVFYAHTISPIAIALLFAIALMTFLFTIHPVLSLVAFWAQITVGLALPVYISKKNGENGPRLRKKTGRLSSFVLESLRGLDETIQYGNGKKRLLSIERQTEDLLSDEEKMKELSGRNMAIGSTIILIFNILMIAVSSLLYINGQIAFAGLVISILALMSSFGPALSLSALGSTLQNTFAAAHRVLDLLDEEPLVHDVVGKNDIEFSDVEIKNLSFAYKNEQVINKLSLDIKKGRFLGIVGKSGSGKSTLLKLIMRFWKRDEGRLDIAKCDIDEINTDNLRDIEAYLTQDSHMFKDTIIENLRLANKDATFEETEEACKKASIHNFITGLKDGYNTKLGELGDTISGGERQRLGLARALLKPSQLLLLDEPTSNLDSLNEAMILKALNEDRKDRTVVLVSHKKSTLSIADDIINLESIRES